MPRRGSNAVSLFLLGGYDLKGTLTQFDDNHSALTERVDTLGDTYEEHAFVGVRTAEISQQGFFDDDAAAGHGAITTGPGVGRILMYGAAGTATGAELTCYASAVEVSFGLMAERGALHKARASYRTGGPVETARLIGGAGYGVFSALGATGQSNILDSGVSSTGGAAYLQYQASAGEANIRVQHSASAGGSSFSTLFTFTKTASGQSAERLTTTGSINRYLRVDISTATATGAVAALNYAVGVVRGLTS